MYPNPPPLPSLRALHRPSSSMAMMMAPPLLPSLKSLAAPSTVRSSARPIHTHTPVILDLRVKSEFQYAPPPAPMKEMVSDPRSRKRPHAQVPVMEVEEIDDGSLRSNSSTNSTGDTNPGDESKDGKRSRRKEQCRVNQANYRKRKRHYEKQLALYIKSLEHDIQELATKKNQLLTRSTVVDNTDSTVDPEHEIATFYYAMQATNNPTTTATTSHGLKDQFIALVGLQCEAFASMAHLQHRWAQHQHSFHRFQVHLISTERLEVGDHFIIKMDAELEIWFVPPQHQDDTEEDEAAWWRRPFLCPLQQRFECHEQTQVVSRITSELDLIGGVASATAAARRGPHEVAQVLHDLMALHVSHCRQ